MLFTYCRRKCLLLADTSVGAVNALGLVRDNLLEELGGLALRDGHLVGADDNAHFIILGVGLLAAVLLVVVGSAATVVKDGDGGGACGLVHAGRGGVRAEEGGSDSGGTGGLDDLAAAHVHGHHGGEGGGGAGQGEHSGGTSEHYG